MANVIGEALIAIRPETTGFQQQTKAGVLGAAKSIAGALAVTFAAEKIFSFGKQAVTDAADVQKANEAIRFEYGKSGAEIQKFAQGSAADLGISTQTAVTTAASFGILFKNIGIGKQRAADMTVGFEKLAGSLSLIKNVSPAASMSALTTAIAGNTRGLRGLGIVVTPVTELMYAASHGIIQTGDAVKAATTKAQIAQTAYDKALQSYGKTDVRTVTAQEALVKAQQAVGLAAQGAGQKLTPAQKAMAIYGIATQNLGQYMREAHKQSGNFADQLEILRAHLANAQLLIGQKVLPIIASLLRMINGPLLDALKRWTNIIATAVTPWLNRLGVFIKTHQGILKELTGDVLKVVAVLGLFVGAVTVLGAAFAILTSPITLVVALGVAVLYAYQHWKAFRDVVNTVFAFLKREGPPAFRAVETAVKVSAAAFVSAAHNIAAVVKVMVDVARIAWAQFGGLVKTYLHGAQIVIDLFLNVIRGHWGAAFNDLLSLVANIFHQIVGVINALTGGAANAAIRFAQSVYNGIVHGVSRIVGAVRGVFGQLVGVFLGFAFNAGSILYNAGVALMRGLLNGIVAGFHAVTSFVGGIAGHLTSIKGPLDYDRKLLVPHGLAIMAGLHEGLTKGFDPVQSLMRGVAPAIAGGVQVGVPSAIGAGHHFHFAPGSIIVNGAHDPAATARAVLDEAVRRSR